MGRQYIFNPRCLIQKARIVAVCAAPAAYSQKIPTSASVNGREASTISHQDSSFMKDAAEGGMEEVKLGNLARQNGSSDRVKKFGQKMVNDHSKMNSDLQNLAGQKNFSLPSSETIKERASDKSLSNKTGADFDKAYISDMLKDHENDIAAFQREADTGTDGDVKAFASKALPTLRDHLKMARDIAQELGVAAK